MKRKSEMKNNVKYQKPEKPTEQLRRNSGLSSGLSKDHKVIHLSNFKMEKIHMDLLQNGLSLSQSNTMEEFGNISEKNHF